MKNFKLILPQSNDREREVTYQCTDGQIEIYAKEWSDSEGGIDIIIAEYSDNWMEEISRYKFEGDNNDAARLYEIRRLLQKCSELAVKLSASDERPQSHVFDKIYEADFWCEMALLVLDERPVARSDG